MVLRFIGPLAALLLVAACQTAPEEMAATMGEGAAAAAGADAPAVQIADAPVQAGAGNAAAVEPPPSPGSFDEFIKLVGDRVFFPFDKFNLRPWAQETLERQAEWLNLYATTGVTIQGHADERGTREYNLALGERRANAVRDFLIALGVNAGRITTVSYGKERPVALGSNVTAWSLNRRAVSVIAGSPPVN